MLATRLSSHLEKLTKKHSGIYNQFIACDKEEKDEEVTFEDPLLEEEYTVTRGLVYKYGNRALVLLTMNCAAYCRFCTRRRKVSDIQKGKMTMKDLDTIVKFLKKNSQISELIFSGGDPLTVPGILKRALEKFTKLPQIKVIRVGSRLAVSDPSKVNKEVIDALKVVKRQPLYMMLHFEHPAEITPETIKAVKKIQRVSTMCLSQSVSLKGVNDSVEILYTLFSRLIEIGVKPYYFFRCDLVRGAEHFIVDFDKEVEIFTELRKKLSGIATPLYVIDAPGGCGKVPVPLNFWEFNKDEFTDFLGEKIKRI